MGKFSLSSFDLSNLLLFNVERRQNVGQSSFRFSFSENDNKNKRISFEGRLVHSAFPLCRFNDSHGSRIFSSRFNERNSILHSTWFEQTYPSVCLGRRCITNIFLTGSGFRRFNGVCELQWFPAQRLSVEKNDKHRFEVEQTFDSIVFSFHFRDAMITVAVNSLTSFASGFVIFMFLVIRRTEFFFQNVELKSSLSRVTWVKSQVERYKMSRKKVRHWFSSFILKLSRRCHGRPFGQYFSSWCFWLWASIHR